MISKEQIIQLNIFIEIIIVIPIDLNNIMNQYNSILYIQMHESRMLKSNHGLNFKFGYKLLNFRL